MVTVAGDVGIAHEVGTLSTGTTQEKRSAGPV
jgi:hypothetical protein